MATSRQSQKKTDRPERTPIHHSRDILTVKNPPKGYVLRWVKDQQTRVQLFLDAGYEFITDAGLEVGDKSPTSSTASGSTITRMGGADGTALVLMGIKEEYYNEDQIAKQTKIDEQEQAMLSMLEEGQYDSGRGYSV